MSDDLEALRYPIGRPNLDQDFDVEAGLAVLEACPSRLRQAVDGLGDVQLDTPYRPDGWTVRQVVHHVPDSHLNAYLRFRWALTEDSPLIKPYQEARWAELPDSQAAPAMSLELLAAVHRRWLTLLRVLGEKDWRRTFRYPEGEGPPIVTLRQALALYSWHSQHHVAHATRLRERMGW